MKVLEKLKWILIPVSILTLLFLGMNFYQDIEVEQLKKKYTYTDSEFIAMQGMDVHYRILGSGPPLVLLHGTGSSIHTWDGWIKELAADYQLIMMDLPAFGLTGPHPERDYSISAYIDFLETFLNKKGISKFALAGNSLGGQIAWGYATKYPEKVQQLILIDPAGFPNLESSPPFAFRLAQTPVVSQLLLKITPKALFDKSLNDVYYADELVTDELIKRYFDLYLRKGNRQAFIDRVNQTYINQTADLASLNMPTLIMWGAEDEWISPDDAQEFHRLITDSELVIYPKAGHVPMEEIPQITARDAKAFLQKKQAKE